MNLDNIFRLVNNFFYTHTFIAIAIVAALIIIACLKPKQTLKVSLLVLGVLIAAYIIYYIGDAAMSGVSGKHQMIKH